MTKIELAIHARRRLQKAKVRVLTGIVKMVQEATFDSIIEILSTGEPVEIRGFGKFSVEIRKPKKGHDFKTGGTVDIPAQAVVKFAPFRHFRNAVRGN